MYGKFIDSFIALFCVNSVVGCVRGLTALVATIRAGCSRGEAMNKRTDCHVRQRESGAAELRAETPKFDTMATTKVE